MKKQKKCDVCGELVDVDNWGNGKCKHCGWFQNEDCLKFPKVANPPNFIALNKAKRLYSHGKNFMPSFSEFINLIERGMEFSFIFNGKKYQISNDSIWQNNADFFKEFDSIEDIKNTKLDGKSLKSNWKTIKNLEYEC